MCVDELRSKPPQQLVALLRREGSEEGRRPVVQHARLDAPLRAQPRLHRRRHTQVCVAGAAEGTLVQLGGRYERVLLP
jgi:hypothetical protein